ncbi:MAG: hypothetical protein WC455_12450 [Dehalococcoidia bacterium]
MNDWTKLGDVIAVLMAEIKATGRTMVPPEKPIARLTGKED